jgi:hypothetical protein
VQIAERREEFLNNSAHDEVVDTSLHDYWLRNLDELYWETRVYHPDGNISVRSRT